MSISIREMKKKLKNELEVGTFVNESAYEALRKYVDGMLTLVCMETAETFKESKDRKVTEGHVLLAIIAMEGGDKDDVDKIC